MAVLVSFSFLSTDEIVICSTFDSFPGFYFVLRNSKSLTLLLIWCECVRVHVCVCVSACVWERFSEILYQSSSEKRYLLFWDTWKCLKRKIMLAEPASSLFFCKTIISSFLSCSWEDMCFPNLSFQFSSVSKFYWKSSQIKSDSKIHQPGFLPSEIYYIHLNKITRSPRTLFHDKLVKVQISNFIINNFIPSHHFPYFRNELIFITS